MPAAPVIAAVATVYSIYSGERAAGAQQASQSQALDQANKQAVKADQAMNQANQKKPDTQALLSSAQQAGKGGASGTMLTGQKGVDPNELVLGKNTLLGS